MGDVKDTVQGSGPKKALPPPPPADVKPKKETVIKRVFKKKKYKRTVEKLEAKVETLEAQLKAERKTKAAGIIGEGNLVSQVQGIRDEVSRCISIKEDDVEAEGDALRAENESKVVMLQSAYNLLTKAQHMLEDY